MTTRELVRAARATTAGKYALPAPAMAAWLAGLVDEQGRPVLERHGDDWRPTDAGRAWLMSIALAWPAAQDEGRRAA